MVITDSVKLPSEEELTVQELNVSSAALRARALHLGKQCEYQNNVRILEYRQVPLIHYLPAAANHKFNYCRMARVGLLLNYIMSDSAIVGNRHLTSKQLQRTQFH